LAKNYELRFVLKTNGAPTGNTGGVRYFRGVRTGERRLDSRSGHWTRRKWFKLRVQLSGGPAAGRIHEPHCHQWRHVSGSQPNSGTVQPNWHVHNDLRHTGFCQRFRQRDPTLVNVTFFYTGSEVDAHGSEVTMTGFQIVSSINGDVKGNFAFQATKDTGMESGDTDQGDGAVTIPGNATSGVTSTPEPASMALWGGGLILLGLLRRFSRS